MPASPNPVLDRVLFSTFGAPDPDAPDQPRDAHGRFAPAGGGGVGPRPDLHPGAVVAVSQGDGFKITTPHGYIDYRHNDGANEIWWVESHKKGHGSDLVDMMQKNHPAEAVGWGVTTEAGKGLRDKWHEAHPDVARNDGAFEGQFDPSGNNYGEDGDEDEDDWSDEGGDGGGEDEERRFSFDPDRHPRDAGGLFVPADGGVVESPPEAATANDKGTWEGPAALEAASKAWASTLSVDERRALAGYTAEIYRDLNAALRGSPDGADISRKFKKLARHLDAALRKYPAFVEPVTSWRGLDVSDDKKMARIDKGLNAALATGDPVTLDGFSSADIDPARAASRAGDNRVVLEIRSRRGAYIRAASSCKGEHEVLHTHGERFKVVAVKVVKYRMKWGGHIPRKTYVLEAVGDTPPARFGWEDEPRDESGRWADGGSGGDPDGDAGEKTASEVVSHWDRRDRPKFLKMAGANWKRSLTGDEETAVQFYTGEDYYSLNQSMREWGAGGPAPHAAHLAQDLDSAIRKFPPHKEPVTSYRGLAVKSDDKLAEIETGLQAALETGEPVTFHGFTSSSLDPYRAITFADESSEDDRPVLKIVSPRGAYVDSVSRTKGEHEILHTHGDRFRVTAVRDVEYRSLFGERTTRRTYTLEAVPAGPPPLPPAGFAFDPEKHPKDDHGRWAPAGTAAAPTAAPPASSFDPHAVYGEADPRPAAVDHRALPAAMRDRAARWGVSLSDSEAEAVKDYTLMGFYDLNSELGASGGDPAALDPDLLGAHDALVSAIKKYGPTDPPVTVWRGAALKTGRAAAFLAACDAARQADGTVTMPCFQSCSFSPPVALSPISHDMDQEYHGSKAAVRRDVLLEIRARTGAWVGGTDLGIEEENEWLAAPGARYKVTGVREVAFAQADGPPARHKVVQLEEVAPAAFGWDPDKHPHGERGRWARVEAQENAAQEVADAARPAPPAAIAPDPHRVYGDADERPIREIYPHELPEPMRNRAATWENGLAPAERAAVEDYVRRDFAHLNRSLVRSGGASDGLPHELKTWDQNLRAALKQYGPADPPVTVWRGAKLREERAVAFFAACAAALATGGLVKVDCYQSCSFSPPAATCRSLAGGTDNEPYTAPNGTGIVRRGVLLEIRARSGAWLGGTTLAIEEENEWLIPPDARFKVTGIGTVPFKPDPHYGGGPRTVIRLEEVGADGATAAFGAWDPARHPRGHRGWFATGKHDPHREYGDDEVRPDEVFPEYMPLALKNKAADWRGELDAAEKLALKDYIGPDFRAINRALRAADGDGAKVAGESRHATERLRDTVAALASAVTKFGTLDRPITVWRGATLPVETAEALLSAAPGTEITFPCFQSCSLGPSMALRMADKAGRGAYQKDDDDAPTGRVTRRDVIFEVRARTGAWLPGGGFDGLMQNENEFLAPPQVKYRVTGVKEVPFAGRDGGPTRRLKVVQLEEPPPTPTAQFRRPAGVLDRVAAAVFYDPDQPRDGAGRWGGGGAPHRPTPLARVAYEDAPKGLTETARTWGDGLRSAQRAALGRYTHTDYNGMNKLLRAVAAGDLSTVPKSGYAVELFRMARHIDAAIRTFPPHDPPLTTYRGVSSDFRDKLARITAGFDAAHASGAPIKLDGFSSASLDPVFAARWASGAADKKGIVLEIKSPRGAYLSAGVAINKREMEVLHTHGERYAVTGARDQEYADEGTGDKYVARTYTLEAVTEGPEPFPTADVKVETVFAFDPAKHPHGAHGHWAPVGGGDVAVADAPPTATRPAHPVGDPRHDFGDSGERPAATNDTYPVDAPEDLRRRAGAFEGGLSPRIKAALRGYTTCDYREFNRAMRAAGGDVSKLPDTRFVGSAPDDPTCRATGAALMEAARIHGPNDPPLTCWRTMDVTADRMTAFLAAADAAQATGAEIAFPVFGSATLNPRFAVNTTEKGSTYPHMTDAAPGVLAREVTSDWTTVPPTTAVRHRVLLEIRSASGVWVGGTDIPQWRNENEVLQPPTARYTVRGWKDVSFGGVARRVLRLDEVPPDPAFYARSPAPPVTDPTFGFDPEQVRDGHGRWASGVQEPAPAGPFRVDYGDTGRLGDGATERLRGQIEAGLKTINPKFLADSGTSLAVIRQVTPELAARGVGPRTHGFADGPQVVVIAANVRNLDDGGVAHVVAHEVAHKWEKKHDLSTGDDECMWALIGDLSRLTDEQKRRWKYVAEAGSAEPITEAVAQLAHPHPTTVWGLAADEFAQAFPRVHAVAKRIWADKGMDADFGGDQPRDDHGRWVAAGGPAVAKTWADGLPRAERDALSDYTGEGYYRMNEALRSGASPTAAARAIQSAVLKYPPHDPPLTTYRGLSVARPEKLAAIRAGLDAALASGDPLRLDGFASASLDPQFAARYGKTGRGGIVLEMKSPRGACIDFASAFGNQQEVLHPHGDRFTVAGVRRVEFPAHRGEPAVTRTVYTLEAVAEAPPVPAEPRPPHYREYAASDVRAVRPEDIPAAVTSAASAWERTLNRTRRAALRWYTESGHREINPRLRKDPDIDNLPKPLKAKAKALAEAIADFPPFDPPVTCWRGLACKTPGVQAAVVASLDAALAAAGTVKMAGFTSASLVPYAAGGSFTHANEGRVLLEVRTPHGAYVAPASANDWEHELLLPHDGTYKVLEKHQNVRTSRTGGGESDNRYTVYVLEAQGRTSNFAGDAPAPPGGPPEWTLADWAGFVPVAFAGPTGARGDLDPDGRWRTVSGNKIHITAAGEIDAGGHPALRQVLEEKAGIKPKGERAAAAGPAAGSLDPLGPPEYRERARDFFSAYRVYPPVYDRLGLPMSDEIKAAWKARVAANRATVGRELSRAETAAELVFPGQRMYGERLRNFVATGDPEKAPPPLPPPGEHPLERAAKAVGAWTPADYPDDAAFVAAHDEMKWVKPEHLETVRSVVPGASVRDLAALACWQPGDRAPSVHAGNPGQVRLSVTRSEWLGRAVATSKIVEVIVGPPAAGIEIEGFYNGAHNQGKGEGTRSLATMLATARRLGFANAHLGAVGFGPQAPAHHKERGRGTPCNGYYTWPMLGFDRRFDDDEKEDLKALPEAYRSAERVSDILSAPGGPAAWKRHGWSVSCDLPLNRDDTPGMRVLMNYLKAKADKRAAEAPK